ncbi:MAG: transcriptional regulator [Gammaproteobacteria bacterium]
MAVNRSVVRKANAHTLERRSKPLTALPSYFSDPATEDFNRLIYERVRLGIMSALLVNRSLTFSDLKDLLKTSDGNLSVHARKLEDAGYVDCSKSFDGRFPKTEYQLTAKGRETFQRYLDHMEALIRMARSE